MFFPFFFVRFKNYCYFCNNSGRNPKKQYKAFAIISR